MLDVATRDQLAQVFDRLTRPVTIGAWLDDSPASSDARALVAAVCEVSPNVAWRAETGPAPSPRRPLLGVSSGSGAPRVSFAGVPGGHEFTSLVLAVAQAGGLPPRLPAHQVAAIEAIEPIEGSIELTCYVSLACHNCPDVVQGLNAMAALNPAIRATMVDGGLFPDEVAARGILGVPAVYLGDRLLTSGRVSVEELLARMAEAGVGRAPSAPEASAEAGGADEAPWDVLVVGGGPAGAAAAIYAARKGIRTGLVAERFGGQVRDTLGIENLIAVPHAEGPQLAAALEAQVRAQGVEVLSGLRAEAVEAVTGSGLHALKLAGGRRLRARSLVLAPGARWRTLGVPGEREYRGRGVAFCPHCDGPLFKDRAVVVVGGGNSGVEAAIDLANICAHVTLLEYGAALKADAVLVERLMARPNVAVHTNARTSRVRGDGERVTGLDWEDRVTGDAHLLSAAGVFVQIGLEPNTAWLGDAVEVNRAGEIVVDAHGATSRVGVFAAGDATTTPFKQIVIAMGEGAKASLGAFEWLMRQPV
jgi:alkyl hydroperoxide reductase subunit F